MISADGLKRKTGANKKLKKQLNTLNEHNTEELILKRRFKVDCDQISETCAKILDILEAKELPHAHDFEKDFLQGID
jgi:hypothetical protein